jgi:hypothetical protein
MPMSLSVKASKTLTAQAGLGRGSMSRIDKGLAHFAKLVLTVTVEQSIC